MYYDEPKTTINLQMPSRILELKLVSLTDRLFFRNFDINCKNVRPTLIIVTFMIKQYLHINSLVADLDRDGLPGVMVFPYFFLLLVSFEAVVSVVGAVFGP